MYAVFIEVNADDSHLEAARRELPHPVVPMGQQAGAKAGYWLAPQGGRGVAATVGTDPHRSASSGTAWVP